MGSGKRFVVGALVVVGLALLAAIGYVLLSDAEKVQPFYQDTSERRNYEAALLAASDRVDADFGTVVDDVTGKLHTAYITDRSTCERRCMTVKDVDGGYTVTLPVAFSYSTGTKQFGSPYQPGNIVSLTYWDPSEHQPKTITAVAGESVSLPEVLRHRKIDTVQKGETVYISPDFIRYGKDGRLRVVEGVGVRAEPGGSHYGLVELARLTRTSDGFVACLPTGYQLHSDGVISSSLTVSLALGC